MADWDVAIACDVVARAHAAAGQDEHARQARERARAAGEAIADPEDRRFFFEWLPAATGMDPHRGSDQWHQRLATPKLRNTGIDDLVDAIVVSGEVGVAKPEPEIFQHALDAIDAEPATTLFVGDNPAADIVGAKGLSLLAAWVHLGRDWELATPRPDYVIGAVWELDALLDSATPA